MFRVIHQRAEGAPELHEGLEHVSPPEGEALKWIDLRAPTDENLQLLGSRFGFHPLALEDCAHADQRPKVEEYGAYLFIVIQGFECPNADVEELRWHELHAFLGKGYLVTVHDNDIPGLDQVWKRVAGDPTLMRRGVDFVYYTLTDRIVDDNFPVLDRVSDLLESIEDVVLENPDKSVLGKIFALKSKIVLMRKVLSPQRDVIALLSRRDDERVSPKTAVYFRDVYDHLARIVESLEGSRDLLGNALDAYMSAQGQRTNEVMKALAIFSAVFLPLTFITGFFGQNFEHMPFGSDALMYTMVALCVLSPVGVLALFRWKRWY